jgi:putative salt-induced outer membrane protein YdiY
MTNRNIWRCAPVFLTLLLLSARLSADEVVLQNGERLVGKIHTEGSKLTVENKYYDKATVDLKDVKTFSLSDPVDVLLNDGSHLHGHVNSGPDGSITFQPDNGVAHPINFSDLRAVAPALNSWSGNAVIGGLLARGNTDQDQFNASIDLARRGERDRITLDVSYIYGRSKPAGVNQTKVETADDLLGTAKYDYFFTTKFYGFGLIQAEHDVIAGIDLRLSPSGGIGYQWVETPDLDFNTEAGVGYLYRKYSHDGHSRSMDARAAYHLKWKVNEKVNVFHDFEYLPGLDRITNYFFDTDAGVHVGLSGKLFAEFKIEYRYDSQPAPGKGASDVRYIAGVGWSF